MNSEERTALTKLAQIECWAFGFLCGILMTLLLVSMSGCAAVDKPQITLDAQATVGLVATEAKEHAETIAAGWAQKIEGRLQTGDIKVPITIGDGALQAVLAIMAYPAARFLRRRIANGKVPPEVELAVKAGLDERQAAFDAWYAKVRACLSVPPPFDPSSGGGITGRAPFGLQAQSSVTVDQNEPTE